MDRITDAFIWPVRDPEWLGKVAIIGLILLVPIAGQINGLGWMLATLDGLRAGEERLPPANFDHLARGVRLFVVTLVYELVLVALVLVPFVAVLLMFGGPGQSQAGAGMIALGLVLNFLAFSVSTLGSLAYYFAMPAIVLATDRGGIAGGLNVGEVISTIRRSPINVLIAGLMLIAAGFIGGLGIVACFIGVVFTAAYALAMQAWIVRSFELGSTAMPAVT